MDWEDVADSELLRRLKARALPHPTNTAFNEDAWKEALEGLDETTPRDFQLAVSAVHFGREIQSICKFMEGRLLGGLTRSRATRLLAALSNQHHITMVKKVNRSLKSGKKAEPVHFEQMGQHLYENSHGQQMTADDATPALIDSVPHWLHHNSGQRPDGYKAWETRKRSSPVHCRECKGLHPRTAHACQRARYARASTHWPIFGRAAPSILRQ